MANEQNKASREVSLTIQFRNVLVSARRIYQAFGFALTDEEPHRSFGHDLVGQSWTLELHPSPGARGRP